MTTQTIINADCLEYMKTLPDKSFDLVLTSPPYDNLRAYNGYSFDFEGVAKELFRVTKDGGVVVWVVGDATVDGSETGTSFKQALYFKEIGFNLHDTMIYQKNSYPFPPSNRYFGVFEYMFVLSKGSPKTFNPIKVKTVSQDKSKTSSQRNEDGSMSQMKYEMGKDERIKENVWIYETGFNKSTLDPVHEHPAIYPEKLAQDHIYSWSNENDTILDPFMGSGTTLKMARHLNRNCVGIEISEKYCAIAQERLDSTPTPMF